MISYVVSLCHILHGGGGEVGGNSEPAPKATEPFSEAHPCKAQAPHVSEENETKLAVTFAGSQTRKGPGRVSGNSCEQFSGAEPEVSLCRIPTHFFHTSCPAAAIPRRIQVIQLCLPSSSSPRRAPAEFLRASSYGLFPCRSFTPTCHASFHKLSLTYSVFNKHLLH